MMLFIGGREPPSKPRGHAMNSSRVAASTKTTDHGIVHIIRTTRGKVVESPFGDVEAVQQLIKLVEPNGLLNRNDFAQDLARRAGWTAAGEVRGISAEQTRWAHILVVEALARSMASRPVVVDLNLKPVLDLLTTARSHGLKRPRIEFESLVLTLAGERAKQPGTVNLTAGHGYGSTWYGRILKDGTVQKSRVWTPEVEAFLRNLAADPAKVAGAHGRRTGNCCFCRRELTDGRSVAVGYGPVCADKFGLPWGETTVETDVVLAAEPPEAEEDHPDACSNCGAPDPDSCTCPEPKHCPNCDGEGFCTCPPSVAEA